MTETKTNSRGRAQVIRGVVVSDKMAKTRVIELLRKKQHGLYRKGMMRKAKFFIHDEKNESHVGDTVDAISVRPLSKNKSFSLLKVVEKSV